MWMTSCTGSAWGGFRGFWKSHLSWVPDSEEECWPSLAHRGLVSGAHVVSGGWKSQVYLSPYVEKPFNSKVIKSFVPELRSRKSLLCFRIPMFYVYMLWTFYVHFTYTLHGYVTCWPTRKELHQCCADTGYCQEDLRIAIKDRDWRRERERERDNSVVLARLVDADEWITFVKARIL